MSSRHIPVAAPVLGVAELENVICAVKENAISGMYGGFIDQFEREFSKFVGCKYGIAVSNGTAAIHLALRALDIGPGEEVLVAAYTNMATFFPVLFLGARPIPIDVEPDTGNINPASIEEHITHRTRAILVVHVFGHPVDMDPVLEIAERYQLCVIEDCAEAHGALYKGRPVGCLGIVGCFSFYANKIITTGEGGMVTTNDRSIAERVSMLKSFAYGHDERFMHEDIGFNYRMANLQAAIGCGQMSRITEIISEKQRVARQYTRLLQHCPGLQLPVEKDYAKNVYWMYHVVLNDDVTISRGEIMRMLQQRGVETRPGFIPFNLQRIFIKAGMTSPELCPEANRLAKRAFYLPSSPVLKEEDIEYVALNLIDVLKTSFT